MRRVVLVAGLAVFASVFATDAPASTDNIGCQSPMTPPPNQVAFCGPIECEAGATIRLTISNISNPNNGLRVDGGANCGGALLDCDPPQNPNCGPVSGTAVFDGEGDCVGGVTLADAMANAAVATATPVVVSCIVTPPGTPAPAPIRVRPRRMITSVPTASSVAVLSLGMLLLGAGAIALGRRRDGRHEAS